MLAADLSRRSLLTLLFLCVALLLPLSAVQYLMVQMRSVRAHWRNTAYNFTRFFILAIQVGVLSIII